MRKPAHLTLGTPEYAEYQKKIKDDQAATEARQKKAETSRRSALFGSSKIPARHKCFVDNPVGQWGLELGRLRERLIDGFLAGLLGKRGTGKTQMAVELIRHTTLELGKPAQFCSAMDFFLEIKSTFGKNSEEDERQVIARFARFELLVMDEFQERGETEWEDRILTHLIDKRYGDQKSTLLIANLGKAEFLKAIGASAKSRMEETGGIIECGWDSFRTRKAITA